MFDDEINKSDWDAGSGQATLWSEIQDMYTRNKERYNDSNFGRSMGDNVGGSGIFANMSKGDLGMISSVGSLLGSIEDRSNKAKDLAADARMMPTEALLKTGYKLPRTGNQTRQLMGDVFAMNDQMQNIADREAREKNNRIITDFLSSSRQDITGASDPVKTR